MEIKYYSQKKEEQKSLCRLKWTASVHPPLSNPLNLLSPELQILAALRRATALPRQHCSWRMKTTSSRSSFASLHNHRPSPTPTRWRFILFDPLPQAPPEASSTWVYLIFFFKAIQWKGGSPSASQGNDDQEALTTVKCGTHAWPERMLAPLAWLSGQNEYDVLLLKIQHVRG